MTKTEMFEEFDEMIESLLEEGYSFEEAYHEASKVIYG